MNYTNFVTLRVLLALVITLIGLPMFILLESNWLFFILATLAGWITNNIAQIGYHRWLCHKHFEPSWWARKLMLFCIVISGLGKPAHHVLAHLNHHAKTDTKDDTHSPKYLPAWKIFLGRYNTPTHIKPMQMKSFMKNTDAMFVTQYYWQLYFLLAIVHFLISPWLLVWLAFNFTHGFLAFNIQNYFGHSGKKGIPTEIHPVVNALMLGEGIHDSHHKNPSASVYGKKDWSGRFIVPLLKH